MKYKKYIIPFSIVAIIVALPWIIPNYLYDKQSWLMGVSSLGTLGALLFLIIDKIEKEKQEKQIFWHEHLPYLTLGSPCDPTQNRCEINLASNDDDEDENDGRGIRLFSIANFSNANAYNIRIEISTDESFGNNFSRMHYIDFIPIKKNIDEDYYIYSKYHISPTTFEVRVDEFKICDFANNCDVQKGMKILFIKISSTSSPEILLGKKIETIFKINLECSEQEKYIFINSIIRTSYKTFGL